MKEAVQENWGLFSRDRNLHTYFFQKVWSPSIDNYKLIHRGSSWESIPKPPPLGCAGQQARHSSLWAVCLGRVKQVGRKKKSRSEDRIQRQQGLELVDHTF